MSKPKETPFHYWNHRIITKLFNNGERGFSIAEVHYENDIPQGYGDKSMLQDFESVKDLIWTNNRIKLAFKKPVLDGDNGLKEWKVYNTFEELCIEVCGPGRQCSEDPYCPLHDPKSEHFNKHLQIKKNVIQEPKPSKL
jgi:hypothetical protein